MSNLYIDLETIPAQEPTDEEVKACSLKKTPETIQKDFDENYDALLQKALKKKGVSIYDSKVICIGFAFDDQEPQSVIGTEQYLLQAFENIITEHYQKIGGSKEASVLIGYNSASFDFPILYLRACLYKMEGLKSVFYFCSKEDVMKLGTFNQYKMFVSMDNLCKFFKIEGKGDIDGSMVYPMYKDGKIDEIAEYCRQDVEKTRKLYKILKI